MFQFVAALTLAVAGTTSASLAEQAGAGLKWTSDYGQALQATRKDERPLLVVIESPQGESQAISSDLLTGESTKLLAKYNLCRVDASSSLGREVAASFRATQLPHVAIIDRSGSVVLQKFAGQPEATEWSAALERHQLGLRSTAQVQTTNYRGSFDASNAFQPSAAVSSPGYCPSCQRAAQQRAAMGF